MKIDFESIEQKTHDIIDSEAYSELVESVKRARKIFLIGNGGLHYVASHMSTDLSRLIPDKTCYSFDNVGFITSNANDHGYEHIFERWLETTAMVEDPSECLIVGMSCSGNSTNVINALHWGDDKGFSTHMMSGQKSKKLRENIKELVYNCEYFHTVEVMTMMLFYEMIHQTGNHCPSINQEKKRMANSPLRS